MTLTWCQISFVNFLGHIIHHSKRLEELNTMVVKSLTYIFGVQSYDRKTKSSKIGHFDISWPLEANYRWPEVKSEKHYGKVCKRAIECFFPRPPSPYSSRATASFVGKCWTQWDYGEIWPLVTSRDVIFDLSEKMNEVLSVDLLPSFRMPFAASRYVA